MTPTRRGSTRGSSLRPKSVAFKIAAGFWVLSTIYILVSTALAARSSVSVENVRQIELLKGLGYVLVSALLLYALTVTLLKRVRDRDDELARYDDALGIAERRAFAANVAAMITHDINNYLTIGLATSDRLAASSGLDATERKMVKLLRDQCGRVAELTRRLQRLGHQEASAVFERMSVEPFVRETVEFVRHHPQVRDCELRVAGTLVAEISGAPVMIQQALTNVILNAAQACGGKGTVEVALGREGNEAVIAVDDDGPGVPEDQRERIFNVFHSTRREGGGLGLASAKACLETHGGRIGVSDSRLGGARFEIRLPIDPRREEREPALAG